MVKKQKSQRQLGTDYENSAVAYLQSLGYRIIDRNYRTSYGEIDIVAEDKDFVIVYIEVKYRQKNTYGDPLEAVDIRKQKRICRVALHHMVVRGFWGERSFRFDVIGIYGDGKIRHVKDAFPYQGGNGY